MKKSLKSLFTLCCSFAAVALLVFGLQELGFAQAAKPTESPAQPAPDNDQRIKIVVTPITVVKVVSSPAPVRALANASRTKPSTPVGLGKSPVRTTMVDDPRPPVPSIVDLNLSIDDFPSGAAQVKVMLELRAVSEVLDGNNAKVISTGDKLVVFKTGAGAPTGGKTAFISPGPGTLVQMFLTDSAIAGKKLYLLTIKGTALDESGEELATGTIRGTEIIHTR